MVVHIFHCMRAEGPGVRTRLAQRSQLFLMVLTLSRPQWLVTELGSVSGLELRLKSFELGLEFFLAPKLMFVLSI